MDIKYTLILTASLLSFVGNGCPKAADKSHPNILIILVDDMGYSDISCSGGEISTPNIDKLAENGLRMTQFYNASRCSPSRAALLTGLYPHLAGMGHQNQDRNHPSYRGRIADNATTIPEVLKSNGYATYQVGKWHVGNDREYWPDKKGFDQFFTLIEGAMNYYNQWPWIKGQKPMELTYNGKPYVTGKDFYATATFSDTASAFIERHDQSKPFFMYLAYNAPHWPLHAPQKDIERYKGKFMDGWDKIREELLKRMKNMGILDKDVLLSERFHSTPAWNSLSDSSKIAWDLKMALYAAVMDNLDSGIGQVINTLKETGQLENTMIIFLSDNGASFEDPVPPDAPWSNHPNDGLPGSERSFPSYGTPWANVGNTPYSYFKSYLHEGGIITPLIVHYPAAVPAEMINDSTVGHIMDLMPTCLDLANIEFPDKINGRSVLPTTGISLLPTFTGKRQAGHKDLFWEHQFNKAVRTDDWKLVSAFKILDKKGIDDQWELYNLKEDPTEQNNIAEKFPEKVVEFEKLFNDWSKKMGILNFEEMKNH